jgi:hypothetical protein
MGYLRDQEGIIQRYLGERGAWNAHLEHTRKFIADSFRDLRPDSVAVLGSGWLLDVPLEELLAGAERIFLVDVAHPPQIRKKVSSMKGVELLERDLSGGAIREVWEFCHRGRRDPFTWLRELQLRDPLEDINPAATVSVNLLNQLDILLADYLLKKRYSEPEFLEGLRQRVQSFHLEWTGLRPGCLVTDVLEINRNRQGMESERRLLYTKLPEGKRKEEWEWEFDIRGNYRSGQQTRMKVRAVEWA